MERYPTILSVYDRSVPRGRPCYGFRKYDGSNLRWEWSKKRGWYKFGTRERLFGADEAPFNEAIPIFREQVGPQVEALTCGAYPGATRIVAFTEFWGAQSFAGVHVGGDPKFLTLIDVSVRDGFIPPKEFWKLFSGLGVAPVLTYVGNLNREIIETVKQADPGPEGVVFKGADAQGQVWMAKVKTEAYLGKLKERFGRGWERYA